MRGALMLLAGCVAAEPEPLEAPEPPVDTGRTFLFAFAALADPHVTGEGDRADRLRAVVDWLEAEAAPRGIELAVVLGDVGWGDGRALAPEILAAVSIPVVALRGDNELQVGEEQAFHATWSPSWEALGGRLDGLRSAPAPVDDPVRGGPSWLVNLAFAHRGVRFVALDWSTRVVHPLLGEMPDLHDFPGGTLPWLRGELELASAAPAESVVLLSHEPMVFVPGGFDQDEWAALTAVTAPHADRVWANLAGHWHADVDEPVPEAGYDLHVLDATWDDELTLRVFEAWRVGDRLAWSWERVVLE